MLSKLSRYGVSDRELQWLTDYLFLRKQIVHFNGELSELKSRLTLESLREVYIFSGLFFLSIFFQRIA